MWHLILFAICILVLAIVITKLTKKKKSEKDTYVCDICGQKDCLCHKEEKG